MALERLATNLNLIRERIKTAAVGAGREPGEVTLVAVTKRTPPEWARELFALNQLEMGENYPQELWTKAETLQDLPEIRWHMIGHIQTNKLKRILPVVRMVHAVDSLKLLAAVADLLPLAPHLTQICLQVNLSEEESKHGWSADSIRAEADQIARLIEAQKIPVTGLMTIAGWGTDGATARPTFIKLRRLSEELKARTGLPLRDLSMGMSGDFEAAIAEGATHVRVGSSLFEGLGEAEA